MNTLTAAAGSTLVEISEGQEITCTHVHPINLVMTLIMSEKSPVLLEESVCVCVCVVE